MRLEEWLNQLVEIATAGLKELEKADSDAAYCRAAEQVAGRLEFFCGDLLLAKCDLNRRSPADGTSEAKRQIDGFDRRGSR